MKGRAAAAAWALSIALTVNMPTFAGQYVAWCSKTAQAPDIGITWDRAMLALFEAAQLLDAAEMNAESNAGYDYVNPQ